MKERMHAWVWATTCTLIDSVMMEAVECAPGGERVILSQGNQGGKEIMTEMSWDLRKAVYEANSPSSHPLDHHHEYKFVDAVGFVVLVE